ncbi:hypothetical protein EVAR_74937_1 [Eumeta japonica]|uniref:Uncharacterized protein n=1 Tax=Eumeta variegata TaxID=151549 RepID=A0A4C1UIC0_EUMVA|nr:hypothetical protein EVAR_74937_1 [Eumeta japonica]
MGSWTHINNLGRAEGRRRRPPALRRAAPPTNIDLSSTLQPKKKKRRRARVRDAVRANVYAVDDFPPGRRGLLLWRALAGEGPWVLHRKKKNYSSRMDRTMYGKVLPGTYYPFRCAMKENGISPGCKAVSNNDDLEPGPVLSSKPALDCNPDLRSRFRF